MVWEIFKKSGENKKLRKIYPKNHENFKKRKSRVQFYWSLQKKGCTVIFITIKVHEYFSVMVSGNDCKYYNLNES